MDRGLESPSATVQWLVALDVQDDTLTCYEVQGVRGEGCFSARRHYTEISSGEANRIPSLGKVKPNSLGALRRSERNTDSMLCVWEKAKVTERDGLSRPSPTCCTSIASSALAAAFTTGSARAISAIATFLQPCVVARVVAGLVIKWRISSAPSRA